MYGNFGVSRHPRWDLCLQPLIGDLHSPVHCLLVAFQGMLPPKFATANAAAEFFGSMDFLVLDKICRVSTAKCAHIALVWLLARVSSSVDCYER